jgi:hypothetical protein
MAGDEAPAATFGGANGNWDCDRTEIGSAQNCRFDLRNGPTSFVAAEIHLGRKPAGIFDGWLHCNIQIACHLRVSKISSNIKWLKLTMWCFSTRAAAKSGQIAQKLVC